MVLSTVCSVICSAKSILTEFEEKAELMPAGRHFICGGYRMKAIRWAEMALILLFIGIFAISSAGILSPDRQLFTPLKLEEVLSIGSLDDDLLLQWVGVTVDKQGFIYVTDSLDYSLKKFDIEGQLVKKSGGRGQGPGEFMAPRLLDSTEKYLYATDQILPGILVFDKDLNFEARIPIQEPISDMKILGADRIIVVPFVPNGPNRICIYNREGTSSQLFTSHPESRGLMMEHFSFDCDEGMNFYLAYTFQDKIEKYSAQGKKIWENELFGAKKAKTKEIAGYSLPVEIVYKDVTLDKHGNVFVLAGNLSDNPGRDVFVFDSQGFWRTTLILADSSHCISIDDNGYLYSRADAGVTLKKYKIHYRPALH